MQHILWTILCAFLFFSCGQNKTGSSETGDSNLVVADSTANQPLYPFTQYLQGQLAYVDTTPIAVERIIQLDGKTIDSGFMDKVAFKNAMAFLLTTDPNANALRSKYHEESFQDLSIPSITFSITTPDSNLSLQQADILLNPNTKKVKHVMLTYNIANPDSTVLKRVLWEHNMKCQVVEIVEAANGKTFTRSTRYIWDRPF